MANAEDIVKKFKNGRDEEALKDVEALIEEKLENDPEYKNVQNEIKKFSELADDLKKMGRDYDNDRPKRRGRSRRPTPSSGREGNRSTSRRVPPKRRPTSKTRGI